MAAGLSLLTSEKDSETPGEQNLEEPQGHWGQWEAAALSGCR